MYISDDLCFLITAIIICAIICVRYNILSYKLALDKLEIKLNSYKETIKKLENKNSSLEFEISSLESKYNSLLKHDNLNNKNINELKDKLKYFENRYNTNEVHSRVF